jgi:hypothetical protein
MCSGDSGGLTVRLPLTASIFAQETTGLTDRRENDERAPSSALMQYFREFSRKGSVKDVSSHFRIYYNGPSRPTAPNCRTESLYPGNKSLPCLVAMLRQAQLKRCHCRGAGCERSGDDRRGTGQRDDGRSKSTLGLEQALFRGMVSLHNLGVQGMGRHFGGEDKQVILSTYMRVGMISSTVLRDFSRKWA